MLYSVHKNYKLNNISASKRQIQIGQYFFPKTASFPDYGWNSELHNSAEPLYDEIIQLPQEKKVETKNIPEWIPVPVRVFYKNRFSSETEVGHIKRYPCGSNVINITIQPQDLIHNDHLNKNISNDMQIPLINQESTTTSQKLITGSDTEIRSQHTNTSKLMNSVALSSNQNETKMLENVSSQIQSYENIYINNHTLTANLYKILIKIHRDLILMKIKFDRIGDFIEKLIENQRIISSTAQAQQFSSTKSIKEYKNYLLTIHQKYQSSATTTFPLPLSDISSPIITKAMPLHMSNLLQIKSPPKRHFHHNTTIPQVGKDKENYSVSYGYAGDANKTQPLSDSSELIITVKNSSNIEYNQRDLVVVTSHYTAINKTSYEGKIASAKVEPIVFSHQPSLKQTFARQNLDNEGALAMINSAITKIDEKSSQNHAINENELGPMNIINGTSNRTSLPMESTFWIVSHMSTIYMNNETSNYINNSRSTNSFIKISDNRIIETITPRKMTAKGERYLRTTVIPQIPSTKRIASTQFQFFGYTGKNGILGTNSVPNKQNKDLFKLFSNDLWPNILLFE